MNNKIFKQVLIAFLQLIIIQFAFSVLLTSLLKNEQVIALLVYILNIVVLAIFLKINKAYRFKITPSVKGIIYSFCTGIVYCMVLRLTFEKSITFNNSFVHKNINGFLFVSNLLFFAPLVEELVFRQWILKTFINHSSNIFIGVTITSILFSLIHLDNSMLAMFLFSLIASTLYLKFDIFSSLVFHVTYNFAWLLTN